MGHSPLNYEMFIVRTRCSHTYYAVCFNSIQSEGKNIYCTGSAIVLLVTQIQYAIYQFYTVV
jgi:hypothetical protein